MTDQEAYLLILDGISLIRNNASWGQITIDISKGVVRHVNLTTALQPKEPDDNGGESS